MNKNRNDNRRNTNNKKNPHQRGGGSNNRRNFSPGAASRRNQPRSKDADALMREADEALQQPVIDHDDALVIEQQQFFDIPQNSYQEQFFAPDTPLPAVHSVEQTEEEGLPLSSESEIIVAGDEGVSEETEVTFADPEQAQKRVNTLAETPFVIELTKKVQNYLRSTLLVEDGETIVCAVSGGVDSIVLLDILVRLRQVNAYEIHVAHLNHKLRDMASDRDELFVRDVAMFYGLVCHSVRKNVLQYAKDNKLSVEVAARESRYRYLAHITKSVEATALATAHTIDDSVETFLVNLMRGSGLTGLSGIPPFRPFTKQARLIRPLLDIRKSDVLRYARERGLTWCEDETNGLPLYTRNKIRLQLLPELAEQYNPAIVEVLHRTTQLLHGADKAIGLVTEKSLTDVIEEFSPTKVTLRVAPMKLLSPFIQGEVVQKAVQRYMYLPALPLNAVDRILGLFSADTGAKVTVSKRLIALRDRDTVLLAENMPVFHVKERVEKNKMYKFGNWRISLQDIPAEQVRFTRDTGVEFFDSDLLPSTLTVRTWQHGDSFKPLGMEGTMLVSDYLTNMKVPTFDKAKVLVLATSEHIVWVCDKRASHEFRITGDTKRALRVEFRYIS